jgi:outer membrane protein assembly factor BamB
MQTKTAALSLAKTRFRLTFVLLLTVSAPAVAAGSDNPDKLVRAAPASFEQDTQLGETADTSANASLGDLDSDGDLDIVLAKGRHWPLVDFVLLNDGDGGFEERHEVGGQADRSYAAALADLDGDGDLDLVVGNDRPDDKRVYANDGTGHFAVTGTFGHPDWPTRNVTVADLTGDGRPEIVVANRGGSDNRSANYVCVNDGHGNFPTCDVLSTESATTIAAGDLDGDGFVDLVVPHRDGGQSFMFVNDGSGAFDDRRKIGPAVSATRAVALGDLNGDGHLDIIIGDEDAGGAQLYLNGGDATFSSPFALGADAGLVYSIAVADLDADGDFDVVFGNRDSPGAVLTNDGTGRSFDLTRFGDGEGAIYGLAIGDVDGDGNLDIVAARSGAPNMLYRARTAAHLDASQQWPQWRGPLSSGVALHANPPLHWRSAADGRSNVAWTAEIPGNSLSTPIVWGDRIFLMSSVSLDEAAFARNERAAADIKESGGWPPDVSPVAQAFIVMALSAENGRVLWKRTARQAVPHESHYLDSSWSSASPITDGKRLFAFFGSNGLYAYDLDGELLWEKDLGDQTTRRGFGEGASPALLENRLVVPWDHEGDSFVVALDARTGEELWRTERPGEVTTWATPLIAPDGAGGQVILPGTGKSRGYDLATGEELWSLAGMTVNTIPSPVLDEGLVYLASGYRGTMLQVVDLAAARELGGDLEGKPALVWSHTEHTPYVPSVVVSEGLVYFMKHYKNILSCLDAKTGEVKYQTRIEGLTSVWSSLAVASGRLYVVGRDGRTAVIKLGPEYELLALNELDDNVDASPVFVGDRLYLRGRKRLYALEGSTAE